MSRAAGSWRIEAGFCRLKDLRPSGIRYDKRAANSASATAPAAVTASDADDELERDMTAYIALLRAVNVGGTGKLPMSDLKQLCESAGFEAVQTYIASGNVVFASEKSEAEVKAVLEAKLQTYAGKPVGVLVRTAAQMAEVLANNPFPDAPPNRAVAIFLDGAPAPDTLASVAGQNGEELRLGSREVYVHYAEGMAQSKLHIPAARAGTARNMNTVAKLAAMAAERDEVD